MVTRITEKLHSDGIICLEEVKVVKYGLINIANNLLGLFITLFIGFYFGYLVESFILWLMVLPLRKNAGGFHANTKIGCFLLSTIMLLTSFAYIKYSEWSTILQILVSIVLFVIIFTMAPVENHNKRLSIIEQLVYKKRTRIVLIMDGLLFVISIFLKWKALLTLIMVSLFIVSISLVSGRFKNLKN